MTTEVEIPQAFGQYEAANVQELAANLSGEVPKRYLRLEAEAEPVDSSAAEIELPVIDAAKLLDSDHVAEELAKLGRACREWGFFQVTNHSVSETIINKMSVDIMEFFRLPLKEREAFNGKNLGYSQQIVLSEEQKFDWGDSLSLSTNPKDPSNWPAKPATFRDTLEAYTLEMKKLTNTLVTFMAKDLELLESHELWVNLLSDRVQGVRINYYPPCKDASKVMGLSRHSDGAGLTVLLQANDVDGLQIMKDEKWFSVKAKHNAFIINIGDFIEIMSNGKYKSVKHRVVVNTDKERLSIGAFHSPSLDTLLHPLPELVEGDVAHYKAITIEDFAKSYVSALRDGKTPIENLKIC